MLNLTEEQRKKVWTEGYYAYEAGDLRSSNPYPAGYGSNVWWDHGWTEAKKDDQDRRYEEALRDELYDYYCGE